MWHFCVCECVLNVLPVNNERVCSCLDQCKLFNQAHTHKYTPATDILLMRHSTSLFLSISPSPLSFCLSFLIEYLGWKLQGQDSLSQEVNISVGWLGTSNFIVKLQFQTCPSLKYITHLGSQRQKRYKKTLFSNFD